MKGYFVLIDSYVPEIMTDEEKKIFERSKELLLNMIKAAFENNESKVESIVNFATEKKGLPVLYYLGLRERPYVCNDYIDLSFEIMAKSSSVSFDLVDEIIIKKLLDGRNHGSVFHYLRHKIDSADQESAQQEKLVSGIMNR